MRIHILILILLLIPFVLGVKATFTDQFTSDFSDDTDTTSWVGENQLININKSSLTISQQADCACWDTGGGVTFENCTCFNATARTNCDACDSNIQCGAGTTCIIADPFTLTHDIGLSKIAGAHTQVSSIFWNCTTAAPNTCLGANSGADAWITLDTRNSTCRNTQTLDIWGLGGLSTINYYSQSCGFCESTYQQTTTNKTLLIRQPCIGSLPESLYNCYNDRQDALINETEEDYGGNVCGYCKANTPKITDYAWFWAFKLQSDKDHISISNPFQFKCEQGQAVLIGITFIFFIILILLVLIATGTLIPTIGLIFVIIQFLIQQFIIFGVFVAKKIGSYLARKAITNVLSRNKRD